MNRLFGSGKKIPKPTLNDAISNVNIKKMAKMSFFLYSILLTVFVKTDVRVDAVEVKVRKLDAELTRYRDQLKKMRDGPAKVTYCKKKTKRFVLNKSV